MAFQEVIGAGGCEPRSGCEYRNTQHFWDRSLRRLSWVAGCSDWGRRPTLYRSPYHHRHLLPGSGSYAASGPWKQQQSAQHIIYPMPQRVSLLHTRRKAMFSLGKHHLCQRVCLNPIAQPMAQSSWFLKLAPICFSASD